MKTKNLLENGDYVDWVFRDTLISLSKNKTYGSDLKREMSKDYFCFMIEKNRPSFVGLDYTGLVDSINNTSGDPGLLPVYLQTVNNTKLVVFGTITKKSTDLIYFCNSDLVKLVFEFNKLIN